jgi:hypothetical protein
MLRNAWCEMALPAASAWKLADYRYQLLHVMVTNWEGLVARGRVLRRGFR